MPGWDRRPGSTSGRWLCYRQTETTFPPLFHSAGDPDARQRSGRWHREGEGFCQYLAFEPDGAWAELVRNDGVRSLSELVTLKRNIWLVMVEAGNLADLRSFAHFRRSGLDPSIAVGGHEASQELADDLRAAGFDGVLAPSAALTDAVNLTLFGQKWESMAQGHPDGWSSPHPDLLPCQIAAADGRPPDRMITQVVYAGGPHPGFERWKAE